MNVSSNFDMESELGSGTTVTRRAAHPKQVPFWGQLAPLVIATVMLVGGPYEPLRLRRRASLDAATTVTLLQDFLTEEDTMIPSVFAITPHRQMLMFSGPVQMLPPRKPFISPWLLFEEEQ